MKPDHRNKIPGRSVPAVRRPFEDAYQRLKRDREDRGLSDLSREVMTNAIVLHWLDLTAEEQRAVIDRYVPRYEAILGGGAPPSTPTQEDVLSPRTGRHASAPQDDPKPGARRPRKSGG